MRVRTCVFVCVCALHVKNNKNTRKDCKGRRKEARAGKKRSNESKKKQRNGAGEDDEAF